ncbi:hypothetical protein [Haloferax elongans]|uniref:hypothetical protein n=1 Tax=Haloferax elongans TaxID=403191 RepID=UPI00145CDE99|nr:hypothetical protein [Haloferax elongans]
MPTCRVCGATHDAEDLVRHTRGEWLVVHCPDCHAGLGRYRTQTPAVDTMQESA